VSIIRSLNTVYTAIGICAYRILMGHFRARDVLEDLSVDGNIILKSIFKK
jgi:hypothetical protein